MWCSGGEGIGGGWACHAGVVAGLDFTKGAGADCKGSRLWRYLHISLPELLGTLEEA